MPDDRESRSLSRAIDDADFGQAIVVTGHMVDLPDRPVPRFPAGAEPSVTARIDAVLADWEVDESTLLVSGGARGTDIIAAERALARGVEVWLLLALPEAEFDQESVAIRGTDWSERFRALRVRCPTYFQHDELGAPSPSDDVFARNNEWCLDVARRAAGDSAVRVVAVWDGAEGDGPGGTGDLVDRARRAGATVAVIPPLG